jgi:hypothetical protein
MFGGIQPSFTPGPHQRLCAFKVVNPFGTQPSSNRPHSGGSAAGTFARNSCSAMPVARAARPSRYAAGSPAYSGMGCTPHGARKAFRLTCHVVKENNMGLAGEQASAPLQCRSNPAASRLLVIRATIVAVVILTQGLIFGGEGKTPRPQAPKGQAAQTQSSSLSSLVAQARQHPNYQVFAHQFALPSITVVGQSTLDVGSKVKIDVSQSEQLPDQQKEALASRFQVPVGVVSKLLVRCSKQSPGDAARVAQELRTIVTDYKYLHERWTRYRPPTGKEEVKTSALQALQDGEIDKAWEIYVALPRPSAPTGLRIVSQR